MNAQILGLHPESGQFIAKGFEQIHPMTDYSISDCPYSDNESWCTEACVIGWMSTATEKKGYEELRSLA